MECCYLRGLDLISGAFDRGCVQTSIHEALAGGDILRHRYGAAAFAGVSMPIRTSSEVSGPTEQPLPGDSDVPRPLEYH